MKIKKGDLVKYGPPPDESVIESRFEGRHHWRGIAISEVSLEDSIETVLVRWYKGGHGTMEFREKIKYLKVLDKASLTETK